MMDEALLTAQRRTAKAGSAFFDAIHADCATCQDSCCIGSTSKDSAILLHRKEAQRFGGVRMVYYNGTCRFLRSDGCIHPLHLRPFVCRLFPIVTCAGRVRIWTHQCVVGQKLKDAYIGRDEVAVEYVMAAIDELRLSGFTKRWGKYGFLTEASFYDGKVWPQHGLISPFESGGQHE